jgi:hypothetical protein
MSEFDACTIVAIVPIVSYLQYADFWRILGSFENTTPYPASSKEISVDAPWILAA